MTRPPRKFLRHFRPRLRMAGALALALVAAACGESDEAHMVASANVHASDAALEILRDGGSAVDAAIAAQMVLTLVEPQSSGIGGGAFLMHWDAEERRVGAYDGREMAPAAASDTLFLGEDGKPVAFMEAVLDGRAIGVPGVVSMLWRAHKDHGRLDWEDLFQPAIELAQEGFEVSPRLHALIARQKEGLLRHASTRDYFFVAPGSPGGEPQPLPIGHRLKNPELAASLRAVSQEGPAGFYHGPVAGKIVEAATAAPNRGLLTADDLAAYEARRRDALCRPYRAYRVCGMPPPTSGGLTTLMILGLLEPFSMDRLRPGSPMAVHLMSEASRLAYADRARYMADADFVTVPVAGLLDKGYLRARARQINPGRAIGTAEPGEPGQTRATLGDNADVSLPSTSHLAVIDRWGNAVSMTSSVEGPFGSHVMAGGFILNNQLTDFSFRPQVDGRPVANRVQAGKRPRSSMSPTLVFGEDGGLFAALGSPGGSRIIGYVTQTLVALIDWGLDMQAAIDLPRHVNRNGPTELEADTRLVREAGDLRRLGHEVRTVPLTSGLHGIRVTEDGLDGGADRRREGVVRGGRDD